MGDKKALIVCTTDSMIWNFLVPHIHQLQGYGYTVECACSRTGFYFDELAGRFGLVLHEICIARSPFKMQNVKVYIQLVKLIKDNGYQMIHCHEPVGGALGRLAGKRCKKYVMYFSHGFHFFEGAPLKHWLLYYSAEWLLAFLTDMIITINQEDYLRAKKHLHAKKVEYIPGIGVDLDKFVVDSVSERLSTRKALGIGETQIVLVSVGELSIRKNHRTIIEAIAKLPDLNIKLLICGEGNQEQKLKSFADKLDISDKVDFLGFRRDIPHILSAADIFVFPSLWEGLGLAGIEAMLCELPVIGSNRQGIRDYVIEGKTGYLFEPTDSDQLASYIRLLANDPGSRKRLGLEAKRYVQKYSIMNSLDRMKVIYCSEKLI